MLASLPLHLLGGSVDVALSLDLWGIRTFGEFAALPPIGVAARLGDEGIHLQRLASGRGFRRLRVAKDDLKFEAEMELDTPIELLDSLCFVFQRLLDDLLARLVRASLSTNEVRVRLALEGAPDHITVTAAAGPDDRVEGSHEDAPSGAQRESSAQSRDKGFYLREAGRTTKNAARSICVQLHLKRKSSKQPLHAYGIL